MMPAGMATAVPQPVMGLPVSGVSMVQPAMTSMGAVPMQMTQMVTVS